MKKTKIVAITGAAGQISYSLVFRIAAGEMLGADQPVELRLLELPQAMGALRGVAMELDDCAFPLLTKIHCGSEPEDVFENAECVLLVGAQPRKEGMERKDLLQANARIFSKQGAALNQVANREARVLVVGNPANTNALIAQRNAPNLLAKNFTAMTQLDHNRALSQLAQHTGKPVSAIKKVAIWGNHSATQYPDISHTEIGGQPASALIDRDWYESTMIAAVQQRGAAIITARGASSAASAASAAIDHMRNWYLGSVSDNWVSMGVPGGSYGLGEGVIYSYPVRCANGAYQIVEGLAIDDFSRERMELSERELREEAEAVRELLPS